MSKFAYTAFDVNGKTVTGELEAETIEDASELLAKRDYIPAEIIEGGTAKKWLDLEKIKIGLSTVTAPDLILFTKQFRTMLVAGVPILSLLQTMEQQTNNLRLKNVIGVIANEIHEGASLHEAFKMHPKVFSPLYCSMLEAGESSGALPDVLERIIYIIDHEYKIKTEVRSALLYPVIVIVFLCVAFFVLLTFVIPKFVKIFLKAGIDLPLPTKICMILYQFLANYWYLLLGGLALVIGFLIVYFKTDQGKFIRDSTLLRVPIFGPLFIKSVMSRFASIFAILQSSGVGVLESMNILQHIVGNAAVSRVFADIKVKLESGRGIAGPLRTAPYFSPMVVNMVAIGEESGDLDLMLREISSHYDYEVEYTTKNLSAMLGPILIVCLAAMVGFFALAIFLPMWDLTKIV
jgi:type II secretory pathway component PulF